MDFRVNELKIAFVIVTCTLLSTVTAENGKFNFEESGLAFEKLIDRIERLEIRDRIRERENDELKRRVLYLESLTEKQQIELVKMKGTEEKEDALNQQLQDHLLDMYMESHNGTKNAAGKDLEFQKKRTEALEWFIRRVTKGFPARIESQVDIGSDNDGQAVKDIQKRNSGLRVIKKRENELTVAFFANLSSHIQSSGVHQIVAFDHVTTNLGNGYNPHAGDFRAPVAGTYVFATTLMAGNTGVNYHFSVMHNAKTVSNIYIVNAGTASQEVVLQLNQGDDVSIHNLDAGKTIYGSGYSTFSGFLLQQDFSSATTGWKIKQIKLVTSGDHLLILYYNSSVSSLE